jgi:hypothetical protein
VPTFHYIRIEFYVPCFLYTVQCCKNVYAQEYILSYGGILVPQQNGNIAGSEAVMLYSNLNVFFAYCQQKY